MYMTNEDSIDYLTLYFGDDYKINDYIIIHHPTLQDIINMSEREYYGVVYTLCSIPSDMKSKLFDAGIDYEEISDFELFIMLTRGMTVEQTRPLLGDLDLSTFDVERSTLNGRLKLSKMIEVPVEVQVETETEDETEEEIVLPEKNMFRKVLEFITKLFRRKKKGKEETEETDVIENETKCVTKTVYEKKEIVIDEFVYQKMITYIRCMHNIKPKIEHAANKWTKKILIEDDRNRIAMNANKPYSSSLLPLISAMVNSSGFKYKPTELREVPIYQFMDSVQRIQVIKAADALTKGAYGGMCDLSHVDKKQFNWMRDLTKN